MAVSVKFPIEIPIAVSIFALIFVESISTNWTMYRTCYTTLGYNESDCALLGSGNSSNSTTELEKIVQPYVTVISMVRSIFQALVGATMCFFIGPWSDKYGRKPVLLLSFAGYATSFAIMTIISALPFLSPWYVLLCSIPTGISGGFIAQLTVVLCYITDTTTTSGRGMRLAILETVATLGSLIGTLSSSYVFYYCGYTIMYIIVTCCYLTSWLLTFLFIAESVNNVETNGKYRSFFQISLLKKSLQATFRKRENYNRAILFTVITILLTYAIAFTEFNFTFLYLRKTFKWSLRHFTIFDGGTTVTGIIGSLLGVYILHNLLKVNESIMILIGLMSACSSAFVIGFATNNWHIYLGGGLKCFARVISPMTRTLISKMALDDSGAVFGFIAVCETLTMLIGGFIYTFIYNETISSISGILYYFTGGVCLFGILINICVVFLQKFKGSAPVYQVMDNSVLG